MGRRVKSCCNLWFLMSQDLERILKKHKAVVEVAKEFKKHILSTSKVLQFPLSNLLFARADSGQCVQWLSHTGDLRQRHLNSYLVRDPRSFEIHGDISDKLGNV